jgi:hypothetical protein
VGGGWRFERESPDCAGEDELGTFEVAVDEAAYGGISCCGEAKRKVVGRKSRIPSVRVGIDTIFMRCRLRVINARHSFSEF